MADKQTDPLIKDFMHFIQASPTAFHAVEWMKSRLLQEGYEALVEDQPWSLQPGSRYFVTRNGSSLCCFTVPLSAPQSACILGAHTDSPALKMKPQGEYVKEGAIMCGVEVYGGPLLSSWLNRDLGLAGRIVYEDSSGEILEALVDLKDHPFVLPQLAIHLDRKVNEKGLQLDKHSHLPVLAALAPQDDTGEKKGSSYLLELLQDSLPVKQVLGSDLFFYPLAPPRLIGRNQELLSSYRLDNLNGVHTALCALLAESKKVSNETLSMGVFWDHEEIGSQSTQGAGSPFLMDIMERIALSLNMRREDLLCMKNRSCLISVDLAHATHPNYADRHGEQHKIHLNKGIVVKINANQRYASEARLCALLTQLGQQEGIGIQTFVGRADVSCGSTIGPISATNTGIPTVDIGCAELSMHSARELMACQDHVDMCTLLRAVLKKRCLNDGLGSNQRFN